MFHRTRFVFKASTKHATCEESRPVFERFNIFRCYRENQRLLEGIVLHRLPHVVDRQCFSELSGSFMLNRIRSKEQGTECLS